METPEKESWAEVIFFNTFCDSAFKRALLLVLSSFPFYCEIGAGVQWDTSG